MRKLLKLAFAAAFFFAAWMSSNEAKAQKNDIIRPQKEQVIDLSKLPATMVGGIKFYNKNKLVRRTDSVQVGTELKVVVFWTENQNGYSKVVFTDPVKYEPTPEEIKNKQYSFTIKPERTTTYKYIQYYKSSNKKPYIGERQIKVVDKNGKEIK